MTQDIKIEGYAEAIRIFARLTDQVQRTLVRQALRRWSRRPGPELRSGPGS